MTTSHGSQARGSQARGGQDSAAEMAALYPFLYAGEQGSLAAPGVAGSA